MNNDNFDLDNINHQQHLLTSLNERITSLHEENKALKNTLNSIVQTVKDYEKVHGDLNA